MAAAELPERPRAALRGCIDMHPLHWVGQQLAHFLAQSRPRDEHFATSRPGHLAASLRKGDVLLVDGTSRFASAIKYITQSTWSHSALYIGASVPTNLADHGGTATAGPESHFLVEADIIGGVRIVALASYADWHTRICRPVGLCDEEIDRVTDYALAHVGDRYDLKNVWDLARYLIQTPPIAPRFRRQLLALGSGDPTRAICSSLIAEAFQSVNYPVLPNIEIARSRGKSGREQVREILRIRHSSLFTPRDFDVSPYFRIIKPTLEHGFDPHSLTWATPADAAAVASSASASADSDTDTDTASG